MEREYEISVDGNAPDIIGEAALMEAWRSSIPDVALTVRGLSAGEEREIFVSPRVVVRRTR